jgi:hypothetical protein
VVTVATGDFADRLDYTFTSFARNKFLSLHAFIIGSRLPEKRFPEITYHLKKPDPSFSDPLREMYYRRWEFIDSLQERFAVVVDNSDVFCLASIPEIPVLLRGAAVGACVEHGGSRYIAGQGYTSEYLNCGVTFWDIPKSRTLREAVVRRGKTRFRSVDDQLTFNEVVHTLFFDDLVVLPCQYNFRAHYGCSEKGWPAVESLNGIRIYHNAASMAHAKALVNVSPRATLPDLIPDARPLTRWEQFLRKVTLRGTKHHVS